MDSISIGSLVFDAAMPTGAVMISWGCSDTIRYVFRWIKARKVCHPVSLMRYSLSLQQPPPPFPPAEKLFLHVNLQHHNGRNSTSDSGSVGPSWQCRPRQASIRAPFRSSEG